MSPCVNAGDTFRRRCGRSRSRGVHRWLLGGQFSGRRGRAIRRRRGAARRNHSAAPCGRHFILSIRRASEAAWLMSPRTSYREIEPAIVSTIEAKERAGMETSADEYSLIRAAILNASPMADVPRRRPSPAPGSGADRRHPCPSGPSVNAVR